MAESPLKSNKHQKRNTKHVAVLGENTPLLDFSLQQKNTLSATYIPTMPCDVAGNHSDNDVNLSLPARYRLANYYRLMCVRRPKSKAVFLVLVIFFLETFATYSAQTETQNIVPQQYSTLLSTLMYSTAGRLFYPLAGIVADSWLGRYNVIHLGFWLLWTSFAVLTLSLGLDAYVVNHYHDVLTKIVLPVISIVLFSAGSASVEAVVIPFGVDQLSQGASSDELSSYFYYYYMTINIASIIGVLLFVTMFDTHLWSLIHPDYSSRSEQMRSLNKYTLNVTVCVLALLTLTAALLILYCLKNRFFIDKRRPNPIKLIAGVLYFAATVKRQPPHLNRAFRYGEGKKSRIDLAKLEYDGIFTAEEVEDVRTFCWILALVLALVPGYTFTYGGVCVATGIFVSSVSNNYCCSLQGLTLLTSQLTNTTMMILPGKDDRFFASNVIWIINSGIIILVLPIINHLVLPLWPNTSIKFKLGMGVLLNTLSLAIGAFILWFGEALNSQQLFCWLVLPAILFSVAEALVFVSGKSIKKVLSGPQATIIGS